MVVASGGLVSPNLSLDKRERSRPAVVFKAWRSWLYKIFF
jgi:hypothetical protein